MSLAEELLADLEEDEEMDDELIKVDKKDSLLSLCLFTLNDPVPGGGHQRGDRGGWR